LTRKRESRVVTDDGTELFYERQGEGPPLFLCDGLLCDGHVWKYFVEAIAAERECIHWHYPGHGRSSDPPIQADLSPEGLADDAAQVIEHAVAGPVTICGHSLGVQVALELWRRHRPLVNGLVLVCGAPGKLIESFHESAILGNLLPLFDMVSRFVPTGTSRIWKSLPTEPMLWLALHSREVNRRLIRTGDLAQYLGRMTKVDFRIGLSMLEAAGRHDASPYLPQLDLPVLVVAGREDRFTPPERSIQLATRIPGAELMLVPGGTHSLPIEQPDLFNLRVRRFLRERWAS
jgi:pimeloyl-ACP methyl ester carboxylesterase